MKIFTTWKGKTCGGKVLWDELCSAELASHICQRRTFDAPKMERLRRNRSLCSLLPILKPTLADVVSSLRITDIKTFCGLGSSQKLQPTPAEKRRLPYLQRVFVVLFFIHMMGTIAWILCARPYCWTQRMTWRIEGWNMTVIALVEFTILSPDYFYVIY